jgi:hypothetical protein
MANKQIVVDHGARLSVHGSTSAQTDFPHVAGQLKKEQQEHLAIIAGKAPHWFAFHHLCGDTGREGKAPISPGRVNQEGVRPGKVDCGSAANPEETAGTLEQALALLPIVDGVGLALKTVASDAVVLDLDHVRDALTGELNWVGARAIECLRLVGGAYVEVSPSGTGLRVCITGEVPFIGKKFFPLGGEGNKAIGPDGEETAIEVFRSGANLWVRMTGSLVRGVGIAQWVGCQGVIDWVGGLLAASKSGKQGNPDNVSGGGSNSPAPSASTLTIYQVLDRLEGYRGNEGRSVNEVIAALRKTAKDKPNGSIAKSLELMTKAGKRPGPGDKDWADSDDDFLVVCESFRRGIANIDDAMELLALVSTRDKAIKREDYQRSTAEKAARDGHQALRVKATGVMQNCLRWGRACRPFTFTVR